jgi:hypothetical protein
VKIGRWRELAVSPRIEGGPLAFCMRLRRQRTAHAGQVQFTEDSALALVQNLFESGCLFEECRPLSRRSIRRRKGRYDRGLTAPGERYQVDFCHAEEPAIPWVHDKLLAYYPQ